jgi:hypothetical protein
MAWAYEKWGDEIYLRLVVKWTPVSRQKRVEFKMVTDQSAAEWRCPNSYFTVRFIAVKNAFLPPSFWAICLAI